MNARSGPVGVVLSAMLAAITGCVQHSHREQQLERELIASRAAANLEHQRALVMERRLAELGRRAAQAAEEHQHRLLERIDSLISLNHRLLAQAAKQERLAPAAAATQASNTNSLRVATSKLSLENLSPEDQIRQLVLELKGQRAGWRVDGLTYEESEALRVLLRPERQLDIRNPWH